MQPKRIFFDPTSDRRFPHLKAPPTDEGLRRYLDERSPLSKIIVSEANQGAFNMLKVFAFNALKRPTHSTRGMNFGIYAGPGQGKTYWIKQWAATIKIPFLIIPCDELDSMKMFLEILRDGFAAFGTPLVKIDNRIVLPPCNIFLDEAHSLKQDLRTGNGLLKAMESNDGILPLYDKGQSYFVDCREAGWIGASTDPGLILKQSGAFFDRLRQSLELQPATEKEIPAIVLLDSKQKVADGFYDEVLPLEACQLISKYEVVPRKAIAFADALVLHKRALGTSWEETAKLVAKNMGLDPYGMPVKIIEILTRLAHRPVSDRNILNVANCRREQFDHQYAPLLMRDNGDGPLAMPTSRGWAITQRGCSELTKRGIAHTGEKVLADNFS